MTKRKKPKRPCEIRRERGAPRNYFPPGALEGNGDWSTPPPQYELIEVKPLVAPRMKIFEMNSLEHEVTEDIVCRECKKIVIPKGEMSSSAPHTTHYLTKISETSGNPVWNGKLAYSCHICKPPKKRKLRRAYQVRGPRPKPPK